jgi:hypothetical protein
MEKHWCARGPNRKLQTRTCAICYLRTGTEITGHRPSSTTWQIMSPPVTRPYGLHPIAGSACILRGSSAHRPVTSDDRDLGRAERGELPTCLGP